MSAAFDTTEDHTRQSPHFVQEKSCSCKSYINQVYNVQITLPIFKISLCSYVAPLSNYSSAINGAKQLSFVKLYNLSQCQHSTHQPFCHTQVWFNPLVKGQIIPLCHYANQTTSNKKKLMAQKTHSCHQMTINTNTITQITLYSPHFAREQRSAQPQSRSSVTFATANSLSLSFFMEKLSTHDLSPKWLEIFGCQPRRPTNPINHRSICQPLIARGRVSKENQERKILMLRWQHKYALTEVQDEQRHRI